MVNRKEFISRIFSRETIKDTISDVVTSFRSDDSPALVEDSGSSPSVHIPELNGEMIYFEAMKLGIDPSNFTVEELKKKVLHELSGARN